MTVTVSEKFIKWWKRAWWLCVVTLPWLDMANSVSLIFLAVLWLIEANFFKRFQELKKATWAWPLFLYYFVLILGLTYTHDLSNALFTLDKKITFVVLPLFAITGSPLDKKFVDLLKRSFVYSCFAVILLCTLGATIHFISGGTAINFDTFSTINYQTLHPSSSPAWMHFSYIQLAQWANIHPGYFSMYLTFCVVILFTQEYQSKKEKLSHISIAPVMAVFISLLSSRMPIITFFAVGFFLIAVKIRQKQIGVVALILTITVVTGFILVSNPVAKFRVVEEPIHTTYRADTTVTKWNSISYRLLEWEGTLSIIQSHLFFGVGTGGGTLALTDFYSHYNQSTAGLENNSHNQFLQTWMELGLVGLLSFVSCLIVPLVLTHTYSNTEYVAFLVIFILMCLTESVGERQKGIVFFTLFQTLFLGFERTAK